ncbi:hypothetical protein SSIG_06692 [Streptomyces filamentosus NRRL 11379]|uniref:Pyruvate carboxyltransferase n=1 Tax=Streptomyces filamentosus NRRL 15998 TaxID=457431 RepID=D6AGW1_STRFL|nr:pyruvate carboxyltransferase [Streptomyces filamentosus NRRL 15998]EWS95919.1 hypothetical protein SSIG_06692 [Streptomyces filamentosus NRRL 11379]
MIAHGEGLSGSSITYGVGAHTDWEWIEAVCDVVTRAVPTTLLLPGIGTPHDLRQTHTLGIRSVHVAPSTAPRPTSPPRTSRPPDSSSDMGQTPHRSSCATFPRACTCDR